MKFLSNAIRTMRKPYALIFIVILYPSTASAIQYGKCYNSSLKNATHACLFLEEAKKILSDLKIYKEEAEKVPLLQRQIAIQQSTIELLKEQKNIAEKAIEKSSHALKKQEDVNVKLDKENKETLMSAVKYKELAEKYKTERTIYMFIGIGAGIFITTGVVIAIAVVVK